MHSRRNGGTIHSWAVLLVAALALGATGCPENPVGRKCFIGEPPMNDTQAIIASPALECPSRTCLHYPQDQGATPPADAEFADMCTAECESDDDCDKVAESPCVSGFTCAIPVVVGPFCCRKMCICKDFLRVPEGGIPTPEACLASDASNTCCNLEGRESRPECQ
jgi:hypothetical protein